MSQSLAKLKSPYLPSNILKKQRNSPSHKSELSKNYINISRPTHSKFVVIDKNLKHKDRITISPDRKETNRNRSNDALKNSCEDGMTKLDYLNTRSILARTGLLSLQQRLLEIELSKAVKSSDYSFIEEMSNISQGNMFEKPLDNLYEKYFHSGNHLGIRLSDN